MESDELKIGTPEYDEAAAYAHAMAVSRVLKLTGNQNLVDRHERWAAELLADAARKRAL